MKTIYSIITVVFLLSSCIIREPLDKAINYNIANKSNQNIMIFYKDLTDTIVLNRKSDVRITIVGNKGGEGEFPFTGDSIVVVYNDTTFISHLNGNTEKVSRSIRKKDNWIREEIDDKTIDYSYDFTDFDFEEALNQ